MKRAIIKWWISRAIDQPRELSHWLRSQIERDAELRQFERAAQRLANDLRKDSRAWIDQRCQTDSVVPRAQQPFRTERRASLAGLITAAAAVLLIGSALFWNASTDDDLPHGFEPDTTGIAELSSPPTSPQDVQALAEIIDASQALIQPFVTTVPQRMQSSMTSTWGVRDAFQSLATVPESEQLWNDVKLTMTQERQQVMTDLRSAYSFFSQRLPSSTARLLGLVQTSQVAN